MLRLREWSSQHRLVFIQVLKENNHICLGDIWNVERDLLDWIHNTSRVTLQRLIQDGLSTALNEWRRLRWGRRVDGQGHRQEEVGVVLLGAKQRAARLTRRFQLLRESVKV